MTEQEQEPEPAAAGSAPRKLSTRAIAIAAVIAVVVLAGVGTGIYFLTKGDDTPAASSQPPAGAPTTEPTTGSSGSATAPTGPGPAGEAPPPAEVNNVKMVAEKAIAAINSHDAQQLKLISCDPEAVGPVEGSPPEAKAELVSPPELTGDTATVEVKLTIGEQSTTTPLPLRKQNGTWCVD